MGKKNRQVSKRPKVTGALVEAAEKFLEESEAVIKELHKYMKEIQKALSGESYE